MNKNKTITGTGDNFGFEETEINVFAEYLSAFETKNNYEKIRVGTKVSGTVILKEERYTLVDINNKANVIVDNSMLEKVIMDNIEIGSPIDLLVTAVTDGKEFIINGSAHQFKMLEVQDFLANAFEARTIMIGIPTELNHAGYTLSVNINDQTVSLFMPHLLTDVNKLPNPESILNTEIEFLLDCVYKDGVKSYIGSRKSHLVNMAKREIRKIKTGNVYQGFVTGVADFAVFVQFNECLTGMIHKTNLTEQAAAMLEAGQITSGMSIEFYVKDIIKDKLFLTQELKESLWDTITENQSLVGKICAVKDFGLLVTLDYETKGLLHQSVIDKTKTYKVGETINVVVSGINKSKRQITLSLK